MTIPRTRRPSAAALRFHDETLAADVRRRISAISAERDAATIALDQLMARRKVPPDIAALRRRVRVVIDERDDARRALAQAREQLAALTHTVTEARRYYRALRADYRALLRATSTPTATPTRAAGGHPVSGSRRDDIRPAVVMRLHPPPAGP